MKGMGGSGEPCQEEGEVSSWNLGLVVMEEG